MTTTAGHRTTTAIVYTRVSTEEQARDGLSLATQLAECRRYAVGRGWLLGAEYRDVLPGSRDDRPGYQAMLAAARTLRAQGHPLAVVVAALDRIGRRLVERVRCREELAALGVAMHSVREGGEINDLVANVLAAVAEEETRRHGERARAVFAFVGANGWSVGGLCAWGYRRRTATAAERALGAPRSVLEPDPEAAPYVRELFERAAAGEPMQRLALWAARLPEAARAGRRLAQPHLIEAVRRPVYAGRPGKGHPDVLARPRGRWPALVPDETWRRANRRLRPYRPAGRRRRYLLSGVARCWRCGAPATGWRTHPGGRLQG